MDIIPFPKAKKNLKEEAVIPPFEEFYNRYSSEVLYYLQKKTGNRVTAEDIHSESFLYCYEHYDSYDPEKSSLSTWLYLIVNSRLKNYYRGRRETVEWSELEEFLFDDQIDLERGVFLEELRDTLADAIRTLSEPQQKVIMMRFFGQREFEDIARELGTTAGNVRVMQTRALAKLARECQTAGLSAEDWS